jgi:putative restriction endonuclease
VAAAHIVPWRVTHNDDPRNGLALCGLHHWSFDQGLVTVAAGLAIKVSPTVTDDAGTLSLRQLAGQEMRHPGELQLAPAADALDWHAEHVYRARASARLV